ncbi:protein PopA1-like [Capsicum annuum]|uniref:protein PopA1-like n=1 Tax=Capsicum annuum TaxID=4072 RepID=UPI001FB0BF0B|nr:protein PopA1-like [Capsicum annuum]
MVFVVLLVAVGGGVGIGGLGGGISGIGGISGGISGFCGILGALGGGIGSLRGIVGGFGGSGGHLGGGGGGGLGLVDTIAEPTVKLIKKKLDGAIAIRRAIRQGLPNFEALHDQYTVTNSNASSGGITGGVVDIGGSHLDADTDASRDDEHESRTCISPSVVDHPLGPATDHRLGKLLPHQLANQTRAPPRVDSSLCSSAYGVLAAISNCCSPPRTGSYALLIRLPLETPFPVRLACVKHTASVYPELRSNSP